MGKKETRTDSTDLTQRQTEIVHLMTVFGIGRVPAYIIFLLAKHKFMTPPALKRTIGVKQPSISNALSELKTMGMIRSRATPDKRVLEYNLVHPFPKTFELLTGLEHNTDKFWQLAEEEGLF